MLLSSQSKLWRALARRYVAQYYLNHQLCAQGSDALESSVSRTLKAFASELYLKRFDVTLAFMCAQSGVSSLADKTVLLLGSTWGFSALHIMEHYRPKSVVAVDSVGQYCTVAASIVEDMPEYFKGVHILKPSATRLEDHRHTADFLIIALPFYTVNNAHEREYLSHIALQCVKPGGSATVFVNKQLGMLPVKTLCSVMEAGYFEQVCALDTRGVAYETPDEPQASSVCGLVKQDCSSDDIRMRYTELGLDAAAAIARAGIHEIVGETGESRRQALAQDILARKTVLSARPSQVSIVQSNACNLRCVFCNVPDTLYSRELSETLVRDIELNFKGFSNIVISGGEPLMHERNLKLFDLAEKNPSVYCQIISNMNVRKKGLMAILCRSLKMVQCSIDAANAQTYERLRKGGKFSLLIDNLSELVALRGNNTFPRIRLSFIVNMLTYKQIPEIVKLAANLGADEVVLMRLQWTYNERSIENFTIDYTDKALAESILIYMLQGIEYAEKTGMSLSVESLLGGIIAAQPELAAQYKLYNYLQVFTGAVPMEGICSDDESLLRSPASLLPPLEQLNLPCITPFSCFSSYASNDALFCCNCKRKYMAIPVDVSKGLLECFNAPLFQEARQHFYDGNFDEVCLPTCPSYITYKKKKGLPAC